MNPNKGPGAEQNEGYPNYPPPPNYSQQGPGYPGPGYPGPGYRPPMGPGFNFQDYTQRWQAVITGRNVPAFDAQLPSANWQAVWIGLAILGLVRGVTSAIGAAFASAVTINNHVYLPSSPASSFFSGLFGVFIGFFIGVGILYLIARLFGGIGSFLGYAYLISLFYVPLGIVSAVFGLLPIIGAIIGLLIGIFEVYLAIQATASAHRLPMDRATWVVLIPVIIAFVLLLLIFFALAALFVTLGLPNL